MGNEESPNEGRDEEGREETHRVRSWCYEHPCCNDRRRPLFLWCRPGRTQVPSQHLRLNQRATLGWLDGPHTCGRWKPLWEPTSTQEHPLMPHPDQSTDRNCSGCCE